MLLGVILDNHLVNGTFIIVIQILDILYMPYIRLVEV